MSHPYSVGPIGKAMDELVSRVVSNVTAAPRPGGLEWTTAVDSYRRAREGTVRLVTDITQTQGDFRPARRAWSTAQVVDHLLLTERLYRDQMRRMIELAKEGGETSLQVSVSDLDPSFAFLPAAVLPVLSAPLKAINALMPHAFRESMFRYPLIPAISPGATEPAATRPAALLPADLAASLDRTAALFQGEIPERLREITMVHPMIGANTVLQIFALITAHEERHHGQIKANQSHPEYPRHIVL